MKIYLKKGLMIFLSMALLLGWETIQAFDEDQKLAEENLERVVHQIAVIYRDKEIYHRAISGFERRVQKEVFVVQKDEDKKREVIEVEEADVQFLIQFLTAQRAVDYINTFSGIWLEQPEELTQCPGKGTKDEPYRINSEAHLEILRYHNAAYFQIENDITLQNQWMPVEWFAGVLDGNRYKISNLELASYQGEKAGFFMVLSPVAEVKNLTLECKEESYLSGHNMMGILAANASAKIKNCSVKGKINSVENCTAGGMIGLLSSGGQIRTSFSNVTIESENGTYTGGLVGKTVKGTQIQDCYSEGSISRGSISNGICGIAEGGKIERVYTNMTINQLENEIVGDIRQESNVELNSIFVNGEKLSNCDISLSSDLKIKSGADLKDVTTFAEWDFERIWVKDEDDGLPKLRMTDAFASNGLTGSGTEGDPFQIGTKEDLDKVRENLSAHYIQTADIIFSEEDFAPGGDFYNDGQGFMPIGYTIDDLENPLYDPFLGKYDGQNHWIKNLYINNNYIYEVALFGTIQDSTVKRIHVINGDITGTHSVGGIVGRAYSNSNLESLSFSGNIQGTDCVGGITGGLEAPNYLKKCINYGNINALTRVGGISGYLYESKIVDSINCGNVIGENEVGGIVGKHDNYFRGTYTSYNRGNIVCSGEKKGAIVGNNEIGFIDDGSQNNYYLMQTGLGGTGDGDQIGAYTALSEEQMKQQSSFVGFDFENVWKIDPVAEYPYPTLRENPIWIPDSTENGGWEDAAEITDQSGVNAFLVSGTLSSTENAAYFTFTPLTDKKVEFLVRPKTCSIQVLERNTTGEMSLLNPEISNGFSLYLTGEKKYYIMVTVNEPQNFVLRLTKMRPFIDGREFMIQDGAVCYYTDFGDGGKLYKNNSSGTSPEVTLNTPAMFPAKAGGYIYYSAGGLCRINVSTKATEVLLSNVKPFYIITDGVNLYYSNWADSGKIYRYNISAASNEIVCQDEGAWLELHGDYIYYQNGQAGRAIYQISKTAVNELTGQLVQ